MTVTSLVSKIQYLSNGVTRIFPVPFVFFAAIDLQVTLTLNATGAALASVLNGGAPNDYSVTGVLDSAIGEYLSGGTVTYNAAPPAGMSVTILRSVAATQQAVYTDNSLFPAKILEGGLDRLTMVAQQFLEAEGRALTAPAIDISPVMVLPPAAMRALKLAGFDGMGNVTTYSPGAGVVGAASNVQYQLPEAGAVVRSLQARLFETISIYDFGAVGDGVADDSAAIDAFFAAVMSSGQTAVVPPGVYRYTGAQLRIDVAPARRKGFRLTGAGGNQAIFDVTACTATEQAIIMCSDFADNQGSAFYGNVSSIGFRGNKAGGVALAIGQDWQPGGVLGTGAKYADVQNGFIYDGIVVNNNSPTAAAGTRVNYQCAGRLNITSNCAGSGDAFQAFGLCFTECLFYGGNATNGLRFVDGYSFGCVFEACDFEVVTNDIVWDSMYGGAHTILGGQLGWAAGGSTLVANGTSGANVIVILPNFASGPPVITGTYRTSIIVLQNRLGVMYLAGFYAGPLMGDAAFVADAVAGASAYVALQRAAVKRWIVGMNNAPSSGGNTGDDWILTRFSDAGASIDNPVYCTRSTGQFVINTPSFGNPARLASYTVATAPSPAAWGNCVAALSNMRVNGEVATAGTGGLAYSDGTAWRAMDTGAAAAA